MSQEINRKFIEHITDVLTRIPADQESVRKHYEKMLADELQRAHYRSEKRKREIEIGMKIIDDEFNPSER